jgi:hypothetical protein
VARKAKAELAALPATIARKRRAAKAEVKAAVRPVAGMTG